MANDARTEFIDGLRVTADHLQHLQDRLREAVRDLRLVVGAGKIAWGLHVDAAAGSVTVQPGVGVAPSGIRLNIDVPVNLPLPELQVRFASRCMPSNKTAPLCGWATSRMLLPWSPPRHSKMQMQPIPARMHWSLRRLRRAIQTRPSRRTRRSMQRRGIMPIAETLRRMPRDAGITTVPR